MSIAAIGATDPHQASPGGARLRRAGIRWAWAVFFIAALAALMGIYTSPGLAQQDTEQPARPVSNVSTASPDSNVRIKPACGEKPLTIARMQWPSSIILAYVHALILQKELGCRVQIVAGDMAATISSMATTGQPDIAPEVWPTRIAQIWNSGVEAQRVHDMGATFTPQALEGWYIPAHVVAAFPQLNRAEDLVKYVAALEKEGVRPKFISCPADWACALINRNLLAALGLAGRFEIIEPANRFEMDTLIARAVSRRLPVVFYYWQPNAVLAQFDFKALDMGAFDAEKFKCLARRVCADPGFSAFVEEPVFLVALDRVMLDLPKVAQYLQRARMPVAAMNTILSWRVEDGGSFEDLAARFVAEREDVWRPWVAGL